MIALIFTGAVSFADTPEKTVQNFIAAFNTRNSAAMATQVSGAHGVTNEMVSQLPSGAKIIATLGEVKVEGDTAKVEADVNVTGVGGPNEKSHETIQLRRTGSDWKIVPVDPQASGMRERPFVGFLAYFITHPELMAQARGAAKKTMCLSNVKQLGLATLMYSADHHDFLPKTSAGWKAAIMPYVKSEKIFHCPDDTSGAVSYFLDPRVAGKSMPHVAQPSATAMIIEGTAKKTAFRHKGMANIAYVDGHAKALQAPALQKARTIPLQ